MTGDPDDAFDLTQDTFYKGFTRIEQFDGQSSFATWLYRIAVNEAMGHRRRSRTLRRKIETLISSARFEDEDAGAAGRRLDIEAALARLSPEDRAILLLRYQEGLDYRTIAEATGVAEGTVASRLNRARDRIRALLTKGYGPVEEKLVAAHPIK